MSRCAAVSCPRTAVFMLDHPGRPEERTPACELHARRAAEIGAEVVRWV